MRVCFDLSKDAVRFPYTSEVTSFCNPFSCDDLDLDDFLLTKLSYMILKCWGKLIVGLKVQTLNIF